LGQGEYIHAEEAFQSIIQVSPTVEDAWTGLGSALRSQFKLKPAEEAFRKAMELNPDSLPPAYNLALLQEVNGEFVAAAESLKLILARRPGQLDSIGALSSVLEKNGDFDEAIETLEPALSSPEKNVRVAQAFRTLCGKMERCSETEQYIKELLEGRVKNPDDRAALHFSLGSLFDRDAKYDLAFEQYERANSVKVQNYDPDDYTAYIDEVIRVFSSSALPNFPISKGSSEQPVFIIGMPRSGTSLVERILSSHSEVYAAGELRDVTEIAEVVASKAGGAQHFPAGVEKLTQVDVDGLSSKYLAAISAPASNAVRATDKLPHNFQYVGLIRMLFPGAKIIHCVRDARDTCLSCYSQNFFGYHPYTSNLGHLGRHYRDYQRLMAHWHSLIPMLKVPYEEVVENPEQWSRKLVDYCGLDWEEQCLRFYEVGQMTRTASYDQVRQPIYTSAVGRWKHYESHLTQLFEGLGY
jgi:tetratricopeptide (TPR) repeat protein